MPVGISDGSYYETDQDYWHANLFGQPQQQEQPQEDGKLFLVRHGDTDLNEKGSEQNKDQPIRGWSKVGLNDDGIEQAHKAAESLKDKEVARIVSSDLPRAKQTANILGKQLNVPVQFDPNLRTWDMGDYDGSTDPAHREAVNKYATVPPSQNTRPPGSSESFNEFKDRIISTMTNYAAQNEGHNTVLVTHHSPERVFSAWEHAGYPEDNGIHMATYQEEGAKPGGHTEINMPEHFFGERFQGEPNRLPSDVPGYVSNNDPLGWWKTVRPAKPEWPDEAMRRPFGLEGPRGTFEDAAPYVIPWETPGGETQEEFNKNNAKALYQPIMKLQDDKNNMFGGRGMEGGGGGPRESILRSDTGSGRFEEVPISRRSEGSGEQLTTKGERYVQPDMARPGNQNSKIDLEPSRKEIEDLVDKGWSDERIADKLNLNPYLVSTRRKEWGLDRVSTRAPWSNEKVQQLKDLDAAGSTPREIARKLGTSRNAVIGKLNRLKQQ